MKPEDSISSVTLPVRRMWTLAGDGSCVVQRTVYCPQRSGSVDALKCLACERLVTMHGGGTNGARVECTPSRRTSGLDPRADLREVAAVTPVHAIMSTRAACIRADASTETAARLLVDNDLHALPVVDADGRLIGIVGRSDLLRDRTFEGDCSVATAPATVGRGFHVEAAASRTVSEVMTAEVHSLPEGAPTSLAVGLMAFSRVLHVPVVSDEGKVVGIVGAAEVLAWVARALGYVDPACGAEPISAAANARP